MRVVSFKEDDVFGSLFKFLIKQKVYKMSTRQIKNIIIEYRKNPIPFFTSESGVETLIFILHTYLHLAIA